MKIEVHTKEIDPHTEVFALDVDEASLQRLQYGEVTKSKHRCVAIFSPTGQQLTGVAEGFETVREALGYVLDMEEQS